MAASTEVTEAALLDAVRLVDSVTVAVEVARARVCEMSDTVAHASAAAVAWTAGMRAAMVHARRITGVKRPRPAAAPAGSAPAAAAGSRGEPAAIGAAAGEGSTRRVSRARGGAAAPAAGPGAPQAKEGGGGGRATTRQSAAGVPRAAAAAVATTRAKQGRR